MVKKIIKMLLVTLVICLLVLCTTRMYSVRAGACMLALCGIVTSTLVFTNPNMQDKEQEN